MLELKNVGELVKINKHTLLLEGHRCLSKNIQKYITLNLNQIVVASFRVKQTIKTSSENTHQFKVSE